jgi:hypothetical protein
MTVFSSLPSLSIEAWLQILMLRQFPILKPRLPKDTTITYATVEVTGSNPASPPLFLRTGFTFFGPEVNLKIGSNGSQHSEKFS